MAADSQPDDAAHIPRKAWSRPRPPASPAGPATLLGDRAGSVVSVPGRARRRSAGSVTAAQSLSKTLGRSP
jgi:hypothetical protein